MYQQSFMHIGGWSLDQFIGFSVGRRVPPILSGLVLAEPSCGTHESSETDDKTEFDNKHNGTKNTAEVAN